MDTCVLAGCSLFKLQAFGLFCVFLLVSFHGVYSIKKDILDYTDAEIEKLYDQWEESDEPLEEDELPEHLRKRPKLDLSQLNPDNPEDFLKLSKKGQTIMMFATISGAKDDSEAEKISLIWQRSLYNAHIELQRYMVGGKRVLFTISDGSKAWDVKDYLVQQANCEEVTVEGKSYPGKGAKQKSDEQIRPGDSSKTEL